MAGLRLGMRVVAALVSLSILLGSAYAWASYRSFVSSTRNINAIAAPVKGQQRHDIDGSAQNILLVGDDDRAGATAQELQEMHTADDGGGVNTDTVMVLHVPADGSQATGISLPRDSWVNIPGFGMNKLNAAYAFGTENGGGAAGGARLLITVVQNLTGLTIDHYVAVSMLGFLRIASILGPIQVCLNEAANDPYSGTDLPAGVSTLNASQALSFVRQRHNLPRGDLDREVRQQYFLSTEFRKLAQADTLLNPFKLQRLLTAVGSSIVKDPGLNLVKFAEQVQNMSAGNVHFATLPITGTPNIAQGGQTISIVAVDYAAIPGFIAGVIGQPSSYTQAKAVAPAGVSVVVLNAAGQAGVAGQAATALQQIGFTATADQSNFTTRAPDTSDITSRTTVEYPAGMQAQAKAVAQYLPGAQVTVATGISTVTVLLGTDHVAVSAAGAAHSNLPTTAGAGTPVASPASSPTSAQPAQTFGSTACIN